MVVARAVARSVPDGLVVAADRASLLPGRSSAVSTGFWAGFSAGLPTKWLVIGVVGWAALASGCSVDIPVTAAAYACEKAPCDTDAGTDTQTCQTASECPTGGACETATCVAGGCGLAPTQDGAPCDDGDACTKPDLCKSGGCLSGATDPCDDGAPCTADTCAPATGCAHANTTLPCDDGDACTLVDKCAGGVCVAGAADDCDDGKPCTADSCNKATGCVHANSTGSCDDGDACTEGDKCGSGTCQPGSKKQCDDASICTDDSCNKATGCVNVTSTTACDDGLPCTTDTCNKASGCVHGDAKGPCDDGDTCTKGDACGGGSCLSGPTINCDDNEVCTADSCNKATGCVHGNTTALCDDGDACTVSDVCAGGSCKAGKAVDCDDGKACTIDACDKAGQCSHTLTTANCDDGDACTVGESCGTGVCAGGTAKVCDDGNACTTNSCDGKAGCIFTGATGSCDDGDPCTSDDTCAASTCKGVLSLTIACCAKVGGVPAGGQCTYTDPGGRKMSLVPDGEFWMGCNSAKDTKCAASESPQHLVNVTGFWLDLVEVTVAQYKGCVTAGACVTPGALDGCTWNAANKGQHPINCVNWAQATNYCKWVGGELPTEAQWEKAARGGCEQNGGAAACKAAMRTYPWGETTPDCTYAVIFEGGSGCGTSATWPVGQKPKGVGPYGSLDLIGGMLEWVRDGYDASYYSAFAVESWPKDPQQSAIVSERVLRGGSWSTAGSTLRAGYRGHFEGTTAFAYMGFRCMRPVK